MKKYFILLLFSITVLFAANTPQANAEERILLNYQYHIEEQSLTLEDVLTKDLDWQPQGSAVFERIAQTKPVWFKIDLNASFEPYDFFWLHTEYPTLCDVYLVKDSKLIYHDTYGTEVPLKNRTIKLSQNLFHLGHVEYPEQIYVKILTLPILSVFFELSQTSPALNFLENNAFFNGLFYGIMFFLFMYNLILYMITQYKVYIPYLSYILGIALYLVLTDGYYILSIFPILNKVYMPLQEILIMVMVVSMIFFPVLLLRLKENYPRMHLAVLALLALYLLVETALMITGFFDYPALYHFLYASVSLLLSLMLILILILAIDLARKGNKLALIYSIAWSILIAGIVNYLGERLLFDMDILIAQYILKVAILIEGILFSFMLGYQIKILQEEKNRLENRVMEQENMIHTEQMFTEIAHQWRNPLNTINAIIFDQFLRRERPNKQTWQSTLERIEEQTQYLSGTIEDFQHLHSQDNEKRDFELRQAVEESVVLLAYSLKDTDIDIGIDIDKKLMSYGIKRHYIQVLLILLNNAIDILKKKEGAKMIKLYAVQKGKNVYLYVEGNGGGIKKKYLKKIFDLHFSTKKDKDHKGMGLPMAKKLMKTSFDGSLSVENRAEGARFIVRSYSE